MKLVHYEKYLAAKFDLEIENRASDEILTGTLVDTTDPTKTHPITSGIPRFVGSDNYAENFGLQWNEFRSTQLDSATGLPLTFNRFWNNTRWQPRELHGRTVLEVGSGAGRFTEIMLQAGASVVSCDFSNAVEANDRNNRDQGDLFLFQGDLFDLPVADESFDFVFCYGVLQHTPDPAKALQAIYQKLAPGGKMSVDFYRRRRVPTPWSTPKYLWHPITRKMKPQKLLKVIEGYIPWYLPIDTALRHVPIAGPLALSLIPVPCWNYVGVGLDYAQRKQWAIMDTFDALGAYYDYPQTIEDVQQMIESLDYASADIFHGGNGVVANLSRKVRHITSSASAHSEAASE